MRGQVFEGRVRASRHEKATDGSTDWSKRYYVLGDIRVEIDVAEIIRYHGEVAMMNKSKVRKLLGGTVIVQASNVRREK